MARGFPYFQVNAFIDSPLGGNPAGVMPLEAWLSDSELQAVAAENNLSETAFFTPAGKGRFNLRWFTPTAEVKFCGHATLASGFILLTALEPGLAEARFETRAVGPLIVKRGEGDLFVLDAPLLPGKETAMTPELVTCFNLKPEKILCSHENYLYVFEGGSKAIQALKPDFHAMAKFPAFGFIASAKGEDVDYVSRYFAPNHGVPEDPVTGSANSVLAPYWGGVLGKHEMTGRQGGARTGWLKVRLEEKRLAIMGRCFLVKDGRFYLPD
ncbi:MAG TPA: PhzF family phenazine biosynthesis protein [Sphingomonadales bacterium]|nr:PhzF family phenazine biosynthesis protein [Sphingomonadales bacterium]